MTHYPLPTLLRLAWRHALRRPLQSIFFVLGVALGVAMIVAIDLANGSAARAFELGTETVTGRATHQIVGGPTGLDEQLYTRLRRELGFRNSAPVVEDYVTAVELDAQPMRLLGLDPFADAPFRSYLGATGAGNAVDYLDDMLVRPNTVLISQDVAARYGLQPGDSITARRGGVTYQLEIVGLLAPTDDLSRRALDSLLITDISSAQEILGRVGHIDHIDLIIGEGAAGAADLERIGALLPPGDRIQPVAAKNGTVNQMTAAFSLNLTALSLLALVVGMFLIYNTVTFSVVQRRPVLGTLRALGMTRREVYVMILAEAGLLGVIGTIVGLALGVALGRGLVQLVTQTINDLFFVVAVREIDVSFWTLLKGTVIGVAAALIGAAIPAFEATNAPPAGALQRSSLEERALSLLPWLTAACVAPAGRGRGLVDPRVESGGRLWRPLCRDSRWRAVDASGDFGPDARRTSHRRSPGRAGAHGPAHDCAFAEPHVGSRGRAHGGGQRHYWRGHHDRQLPQHGGILAGRCAPGRHLYLAAVVELQSGLHDVGRGGGGANARLSGDCQSCHHARH